MLVVSMKALKLLITFAFGIMLSCQAVAASGNRDRKLVRFIDALVSAQFQYSYGCDGAADGTITIIGSNDMGIVENPAPEVRNIVNLGSSAIPLLIAHLTDTRLTPLTFVCGSKTMRVPVGYVSYDILNHIVRDKRPRFNREDCAGDGLCACEVEGYCFRPDDYIRGLRGYVPRKIVHRVKANWLRAYQKGYIRYHYPEWWKQRI
jgi:hypothetical protein